jgi:hypothetical protein
MRVAHHLLSSTWFALGATNKSAHSRFLINYLLPLNSFSAKSVTLPFNSISESAIDGS